MQAILRYLTENGYGTVDGGYYSTINSWFRWYKGKTGFHSYSQYNGKKKINRTRKTLGMAKKVAEDWANLLLNEKVGIVIADDARQEAVDEVLERNNFRVRGNQLLELAFGLGTGALVEYLDNKKVNLDYIRAGMIYPLRWDNGEILDCAFASEQTQGKRKLVYLNIHEQDENERYVIKNIMFEWNGNVLSPVELPDGVAEEFSTGSEVRCFQIITPNIVNNVNPDCPMGISVFANAIDQLEGVDLVYDSYCNEFRLGKKRIIVPTTMAKLMMEEDGSSRQVFDDNDTEFYALPLGGEEQKIQEINMELRHEAHEAAIKTALTLISAKCGLGNDRYKFEYDGVKTATEVVSEKSELFQNLRKHELVLTKTLTDMVRAIAVLQGGNSNIEVSINFDDSIIQDVASEKQQFLQEIRDGVRQKWEYRAKFFGESEEQAKASLPKDDGGGLFGEGNEE